MAEQLGQREAKTPALPLTFGSDFGVFEMRTCEACGGTGTDGTFSDGRTILCRECGGRGNVPDGFAVKQQRWFGIAMPIHHIVCPNCNNSNPPDQKCCGNCGQHLN